MNVRYEFMLFLKAAYRLYVFIPIPKGSNLYQKMDAVVFEVVEYVHFKCTFYISPDGMAINFYKKGFSLDGFNMYNG